MIDRHKQLPVFDSEYNIYEEGFGMTEKVEEKNGDGAKQASDPLARYAALMEERGLMELEVRDGEFYLKLSRMSTVASSGVALAPILQPVPAASAAPVKETPAVPSGHVIVSPLAGMFYRSPAPNAPAFAKEGDKVAFGDVLCIVEAMKVMNEIRSDQPGVIRKIVGQNGKPVSAGQPLFEIDPLP